MPAITSVNRAWRDVGRQTHIAGEHQNKGTANGVAVDGATVAAGKPYSVVTAR